MVTDTLVQTLYMLAGWSTLTTIIILVTRRDVKLGLKKWWLTKLRRQPIKLRYHGPDKNVTEYILATKGKGETLVVGDKKLLVFKTNEGSTFFLDEEAIRRTDDGVNEISYNYKSIMPLDPGKSEVEVEAERTDIIERIRKKKEEAKEKKESTGFEGVEMENLVQYTDPKRLNRLIEFIKLAAKADALQRATDVEKYVKYSMYLAAGSLIMGVLIWYMMDGEVLPLLQSIQGSIGNLGKTVLNL